MPPLAIGSVPETWVVRLTPDSVPPRVSDPEEVTVPVSVMPLTVPVPLTLVTVPEPLLLNVVQSVLVRYPLTDVVAAGILIAGVVPPLDTTGEVPVTLVTVPDAPVKTPADNVNPPATLISSAAPVLAVVRPNRRLVDIVRPFADA